MTNEDKCELICLLDWASATEIRMLNIWRLFGKKGYSNNRVQKAYDKARRHFNKIMHQAMAIIDKWEATR